MIEIIEESCVGILFFCLAVALILIMGRLREGPSLADRAVALDMFCTLLLSATAITAISFNQPFLFDLTIVLALFSFLGNVAFARFIEGGR